MASEKKKLSNKQKLTAVIVAFLIILVLSVLSIFVLEREDTPQFYTPPPCDGPFAEIDSNEDIWQDPDYLALGDRLTVYADKDGMADYPISSADDLTLGRDVALLYSLIEAIRAGDHELYNSYFSDFYLRVAGERGAFTAQKLYDIKIAYQKTFEDEAAGFLNVYRVGYKIMDNNGSYRNDIASDELRYVYFNVRSYSGYSEIYSMVYVNFN